VNTKPENWEKLSDQEYRHSLAMAQFKRFVPFQIGAMRRQRDWSQQELAQRAGVTQGVISKAEDPDNGNLAANTILRIANGFDVVFVGQFMSYGEFNEWRKRLSEKRIVLGFDQENAELAQAANSVPDKSLSQKYFEDGIAEINRRTPFPVPDQQRFQLPLPLKFPTPSGFDTGLRIVSKSPQRTENTLANKFQNVLADNGKLAIAGGM
jgi:transcriptional regulator with XRE-family HTH domain